MNRQLQVPFTHGTITTTLVVTTPENHEVSDAVRDRTFDHVFCEVVSNGLVFWDELNRITRGESGEAETEVIWTNGTTSDGWTINVTVVVKTRLTGFGRHEVQDLIAAAFAPSFGHSVSHFTRLTAEPIDAIPADGLHDMLKQAVAGLTGLPIDGFELVDVDPRGLAGSSLLGSVIGRRGRRSGPRMATSQQ